MKVYAVVFDWSVTNNYNEDSQVDIELFDTYQKAFNRFSEIIRNEKTPETSWVADAFDENDEVLDGYEFDEHIESDGKEELGCWWNITDRNNWYQHDFLELRIMEVK